MSLLRHLTQMSRVKQVQPATHTRLQQKGREQKENACYTARCKLPSAHQSCLLAREGVEKTLADEHQILARACCQVRHLEEWRESGVKNRPGLMLGQWEGEVVAWVRQVPGLFHSSFLAGTRVRAMMMGTNAKQPMKRAHRGR